MTRLEKTHNDNMIQKYGLDKFETEPARTPGGVRHLDEPTPPPQHYQDYKRGLETKFNMTHFEMQGELGRRVEQTLDDVVRLHDRSEAVGMKLSCASVKMPDDKVYKFWYEVSR